MLEYFQGEEILFIETIKINTCVTCDVYQFKTDRSKDLGIIHIKKGGTTPKQKIVLGEKTIEGFLSGSGKFSLEVLGESYSYDLDIHTHQKEFEVKTGDIMQWKADKDSDLVVYEVCFPPYKEGRFQNL